MIWEKLKVANCFTFESSAYGYRPQGSSAGRKLSSLEETGRCELPAIEYRVQDYIELGARLGEAMFYFTTVQRSVEQIESMSDGGKSERFLEMCKLVFKDFSKRQPQQLRKEASVTILQKHAGVTLRRRPAVVPLKRVASPGPNLNQAVPAKLLSLFRSKTLGKPARQGPIQPKEVIQVRPMLCDCA